MCTIVPRIQPSRVLRTS